MTAIDDKKYDELKKERDRYVEHIKMLIDQRNRSFIREDDLKNVIFEARKTLEQIRNVHSNMESELVLSLDARLKLAIKGWRET